MKTKRTFAAFLLLICLLCGCGQKSVTTAQADASDEPSAVPRESLLAFSAEEGPEKDIQLTVWSYAGAEAAEFYTVLLPVPENFPIAIGTMYEGDAAALLTGVIRGDRESGTVECILMTKDMHAETILTLMYSYDRVALLELDDDMLSFCRQEESTGLWTVVFTDDGPLSFDDAALLLEGILEKYALTPAYPNYGLTDEEMPDLRLPRAE